MLHFILQTIAFQLFFLIIYDLFLRKETFFNWNRAYILATAVLSIVLPFIQIQSFKNVVPKEFIITMPEVTLGNLQETDEALISDTFANETTKFPFSWELLFYLGASIALLLFIVKLVKILALIYKNPKHWNKNLRIVTLLKSNTAFSFFYYVFLGEHIKEKDKPTVIKHEAVHVNQKHTLDLLLFEVFRIVFWFNPLVYMYQSRISSLHEFIADAEAIKTQTKNEYYQDLLSQIFETENVSFINAFYKRSLIKKRIAMLSRSKSKQSNLLKYSLIIPTLLLMLLYTSADAQKNQSVQSDSELIENQEEGNLKLIENNALQTGSKEEFVKDYHQDPIEVPFAKIDEVPTLSGCDESSNNDEKKKCVATEISKYVQHNFNVKLAKELKLTGQQRINVMFKIDKEGNVFGVRSRAPHKDLETEAIRVINLLPKFIPGKHKGKNVIVPYSLPIIFEIKDDRTPFVKVDKVPTLAECQSLTSNKEQRDCVANAISKFVQKNFNADLPSKLGLKGKQRIMSKFTINNQGEVVDIIVEAPHTDLETEAKRTLKLLPKFIPGEHGGEKVNVSYALPIVFMVNE